MNSDRFRLAVLLLLVSGLLYCAQATRYAVEAYPGGGLIRFDRWTGKAYLVGPSVELELKGK